MLLWKYYPFDVSTQFSKIRLIFWFLKTLDYIIVFVILIMASWSNYICIKLNSICVNKIWNRCNLQVSFLIIYIYIHIHRYTVYQLSSSVSGSSLLLVFSLAFFISGTLVLSQTYEMKRSLHKDLLMNYSKEIRPVVNQKSTIEVNITLILNALNNFDEKEGVIHTVFALALKWRDE